MPELIKIITRTEDEPEGVYREVANFITRPWKDMMDGRLETSIPHWNTVLNMKWAEINKARRRAHRSNLTIDCELFESKRRSFQRKNRKRRRRFIKITEALLEEFSNKNLTKYINKYNSRRKNMNSSQLYKGEALNPSAFTKFMGSFTTKTRSKSKLKPSELLNCWKRLSMDADEELKHIRHRGETVCKMKWSKPNGIS